jgi:hypothetical protein
MRTRVSIALSAVLLLAIGRAGAFIALAAVESGWRPSVNCTLLMPVSAAAEQNEPRR